MRFLGIGKVKEVKPLQEEAAIDLAADMLGELFIFTVGAGCIYLEFWRQSRKEENKESEQNVRLSELEKTVQDLGIELAEQGAQLREIHRILAAQPTPKSFKDPVSGTILQVEKR